jgi:hypothetical protein
VKNTSGLTSTAATVILNVAADVATAYTVTAPTTAASGTPVSVTVTAVDAAGTKVTTYSGTVKITSTDTAATLPANATLTGGVGTFSVTLKTIGSQTVTATDTVTSSITGTSASITVTPAILHTFAAGLALISAPVDDTGFTLAQQFDQAGAALAAYAPSNPAASSAGYVLSPTAPANTLVPGQGYWARFTTATNLLGVGTAVNSANSFPIALTTGWNLIGVPRTSGVTASSLSVTSSGQSYTFAAAVNATLISNTLYTYQVGDTQYEVLSGVNATLQPYDAYWIYAFGNCTLIFAAE